MRVMHPELSQVKAVLFDLDGTLLDTYRLILDSMRYTIRTELGLEYSDEQLMAKVGQPLAVQMMDFAPDSRVADVLVETYREYNETLHDKVVRAFDGIPEVLAALKVGGVIGAIGLVAIGTFGIVFFIRRRRDA